MNDTEWLQSLKEGDEVVCSYGYGLRELTRVRVSRTTASQVIIGRERFRRADGRKIGQTLSMATVKILPPTEERLAAIRLRALLYRVSHYPWHSLPLETLKKIVALLPENE